jgi:hypothetical protein
LDILASFFFSVALRALGLARVSSSVAVVSASSYTLPFEIHAHNARFPIYATATVLSSSFARPFCVCEHYSSIELLRM